ncbi:MAG: transcription termination factor NusA [Myxococcota bacterium]
MSEVNPLDLRSVLSQIRQERNIDEKVLIEALKASVLSAAHRKFGAEADLETRYNESSGEIDVYQFKRIVSGDASCDLEISLENAQQLDSGVTQEDVGEDLGVKVESSDFGRIAAQSAKQVIVRLLREAERSVVFKEFSGRKGEPIAGTVRRIDRGNIVVDLGRAEAIVPMREQVPSEMIRPGDRIVAYVLDVVEEGRGAQIILSRAHANLVAKLFQQEVPEIAEGIVIIEGIAREPGVRTKIAVRSRDTDVDPVGTCVGMKGVRVQAVVQELRGEKIDIVPFSEDEARFVCNALAPAEITRVLIDEGLHCMRVVVPDDQLSLAIGRSGQNVRLAAELLGWKIDISSETKVAQEREVASRSLQRIEELSELGLQTLYNHGIRSAEELAHAQEDFLQQLPGFGDQDISGLRKSAQSVMALEVQESQGRKQRVRQIAKLLFELDQLTKTLREKKNSDLLLAEQSSLSAENCEQLQEAAYEDFIDVYLNGGTQCLVAAGLTEEQSEQLCKLAVEKLGKHIENPDLLQQKMGLEQSDVS